MFMSNKCSCCGQAYVMNPGDICLTCQLSGKVPASNTGAGTGNPFGTGSADSSDNFGVPQVGNPGDANMASAGFSNNGGEVFRTKKNSGSVVINGTVQGLRKEVDSQKPFSKMIRSIIKGTAFSPSKERFIFEVAEDTTHSYDFAGRKSYCVIIEGELSYGSLNNNDVIQVKGFRGGNGIISASEIYNQSNGTTIDVRGQISPLVLRVVAAIILLLLIGLIVATVVFPGHGGGTSAGSIGSTSSFSNVFGKIAPVLLGIGLIFVGVKFGNKMGQKTKMILIGAGVITLLCIFYPAAISVIVALLAVYFVLQFFLKMLK